VLDRQAWALLRRLTRWLDQFKDCFGHRAQHVSLRQYVDGLLGDSARKSMSAMLARITEPTSYQAFQHFVTHAPWEAEVVWRRLRAVVPERTGILILDETSFPKSGPHSAGSARQYCGALGKVANCQVAVTAALWTGQRAWPMGALLYLPDAWITDPVRCTAARIPATAGFHEKWRLALTLVRRTRAAAITITAVVADAEYGDNSIVRQTLHRLRLPYALGISPTLTLFRGTPTLRIDRQSPPPRNRRDGPRLTFPQARAFVQEIFTGLLFISRPRYMQWMRQAEQRFHQLRI
jgi:SRSO17 transposase